ncbi:MAG: cap, capsular polysaccharide biosynthsis protein [Candidatus Taylorbacteria bacterium]|nr:cap, capsular polysaccharide biosynthsis protein [Candidatus Taylorbacteria bacterium]
MISRDVKALDTSSAVFERLKEYSNLFDELLVVVMGHKSNGKFYSRDKLTIYNATSHFKIFSFFKAFLQARKLAQKNKGTEAWITSQDPFESGLLAYFVSKLSNIKLQLQFHTDCFNILYIKHSLKNYFQTLIARFLLIRADNIRVVSERIKSSILSMNNKLASRISVLPVWTDIEKIQTKPVDTRYDLKKKFPEFSKIILIVARLESEKNLDLSLLSFKKALRFDEKLGLVIAGNGRKEKWLKSLVKSLNIETNVKFLGWAPDVASLFKTSDLLLVTSFYEGYGLNMVEAVASGCAVVATQVGVAENVEATLVPYDAGKIAVAIIDVLKENTKPKINARFIISKQEYLNQFKNTFKI